MNKKLIIVLLIIFSILPFFLKRNDYNDITNIIHINSIGINYNKELNEFECYFYILNNFNVVNSKISSSNIDNLAYIIKTNNDSLDNALNDIYTKINSKINFSHLKSVIFTIDFLSSNNIIKFYDYIKNNTSFYYNFYIFTTKSNLNNLFNINNFSDISAYHTVILRPDLINTYHLVTYNDYTNIILNKDYTLLIPNIDVLEDSFYKQDKPHNILEINGYSSFNNKVYQTTIFTNELSYYKWLMSLSDEHILIDIYNLYIKNGKYKVYKKNKNIFISYTISAILLNNPNNEKLVDLENKISYLIKREIYNLYNDMNYKNIDVFNIKYLYKNPYNITIKINFELN